MELWIRSQDKKKLHNIKHLELDNDETGIFNADTYTLLGKYKTKERALEVLDEIQKILNPMIVFKNCNCTKDMLDKIKEVGACVVSDNSHIEQLSTCVYEMPKE